MSYIVWRKTDRSPKQSVGRWKFLDSKTKGAQAQRDDSGDDDETAGQAHKQFSLDRIATKQGAFRPNVERGEKGDDDRDSTDAPDVTVKGLNWRFHKFVAGVKKDIVNPTTPKLNDKFKLDPTGGGVDYTSQSIGSNRIIGTGSVQQLLRQLEQKGVEMAKEAATDIVQEGLTELD